MVEVGAVDVCSGGLKGERRGHTACPPVGFTAQHSLGGRGVLTWPSPSGRRKKGSRGDAHTLSSLDECLQSQGGWLRRGEDRVPY